MSNETITQIESEDMGYSQYLNIQVLLGFQIIHYLSYGYRKYKNEQSLFGQIGPSLILKTSLALSYYIVFKQGRYASNDFVMGPLVISIIIQFVSLLIEKQFAQVVYQFTIMVQFSFFVQKMTQESILYVSYLTQYGQNLSFVYHLFQMIRNRNSSTITYSQLYLQIAESIVWIALSITSQHDLISLGPGILQLVSTLFSIRVRQELISLEKKKSKSKHD